MSSDPFFDELLDRARGVNGFEFTCKYQNWMDSAALDVMKEGGTLVQVAARLGITEKTLYTWKNPKHAAFKPSFAEAIEEGKALAQAWWEKQGGDGIWGGKDFNGTTYIFIMKTRFRHQYGDKPVADEGEVVDYTQDALFNDKVTEIWDGFMEEGTDDETPNDPA